MYVIRAPTRERTCGRLLPFLRGFNALVILVTPQSSVPMATLTLALFTISFFFSLAEAALPSSFFLHLLSYFRSDEATLYLAVSVYLWLRPLILPSVRPSFRWPIRPSFPRTVEDLFDFMLTGCTIKMVDFLWNL